MTRYRVIVCDPPWDIPMGPPQNERLAEMRLPYETMPDSDIAALPVAPLLLPDAWLCLWCPESRIAVAPKVLEGWGAKLVGWRVWHKTDGGPQVPNKWRSDAEWIAVGKVGSPKWITTRGYRAVFQAPRVRLEHWDAAGYTAYAEKCRAAGATCPPPRFVHSAKPPAFYADLAGRTLPPRLDMFARRAHPGWHGWGDQYDAASEVAVTRQMELLHLQQDSE